MFFPARVGSLKPRKINGNLDLDPASVYMLDMFEQRQCNATASSWEHLQPSMRSRVDEEKGRIARPRIRPDGTTSSPSPASRASDGSANRP